MPSSATAGIAAFAFLIALAGAARGEEPPLVTATPEAGVETTTPENLLAAADAAVDAGNVDLARALYERLAAEHPGAPEAIQARRALEIISAVGRRAPGAAGPAQVPAATEGGAAEPGSSDGVVVRREPYSTRTSERLRLTTWEKLDFGVTAFLYGMSVGFSYSLSLDNTTSGQVFPPVAIGALAYTLGAVAFLNLAHPDRGDLPLALAITSYLPTTTLLVANATLDNPDGRKTALATAAAGLISVPIAVFAAHELDLDPGDTQLVRDSGFWGLALATTGILGFGGTTQVFDFGGVYHQPPSDHAIAAAGLLGLYGGLGLGTVAAYNTEISLERVRVTTWGGYGGAVLGLLIGAGAGTSNGDSRDLYRGVSVGALAGLVITFLSTSGLDGIPPEDTPPQSARLHLAPTLSPMAGVDGRARATLGLAGTFF